MVAVTNVAAAAAAAPVAFTIAAPVAFPAAVAAAKVTLVRASMRRRGHQAGGLGVRNQQCRPQTVVDEHHHRLNIVWLFSDELLDGDAAPGLGRALWPLTPPRLLGRFNDHYSLFFSSQDETDRRVGKPHAALALTASSSMVLSDDILSLVSRIGIKVDSGNDGLSALFWGAGFGGIVSYNTIVVAAITVVVIVVADIIAAALALDGKLMLPQA
eukprot:CAMPEP_0181352640 /NCGR_PEP_ID=MMETSP1106-20121128/2417_1 /TAXON_ID=81844 /ORGANISM="Mantoniella antarctica, Strain SL-175" /LENGTH=213 /DNA_ID=CAMNT_0023465213 /DNA_START=107 /DNA_END=745 /DNA_ORIENTATION=-